MDLTSYSHLQTLTDYQKANYHRIQRFWNYYRGNHKQWLLPKILPNGHAIDDNVKAALSRKIVDKGNNFLFGKGLNWNLDNATQEQVLADIWGNQETQNVFLSELGINGGVTGQFYIQIVSKPSGVKIKSLDPTWVFTTPDSTDLDKVTQYDLRFVQNANLCRLLHTQIADDQWDYSKEQWTGQKWTVIEPAVVWPFNWPFVVHGKNLPNPNSFYGASDLEDAEINDTINLVASNLNRIIRIFAHPVVWGYGFGSSAMNVDSSKVITATSDKAQLSALELARDLSSPQEYLKFLRTLFAEITNVPESDPERLKIGATSGFALEVLFNDLLLKTGIKRSFYGKALIELNRRLLDLSGFGSENQTKLHWPNPLPVDKLTESTADQFDLNAGIVSLRTLATKRGYDWELEQQYRSEEQTNNTTLGENLLNAFRNGQG